MTEVSTSPTKQAIYQLLQSHGILPTQQRVEIAQILFARAQHLSADQVLTIANRDHNVVSKATVYNTLGLFASKGLVREVIVDPTKVFYDPNTKPHYHFYDVDTNVLTDIEADQMQVGPIPNLPKDTYIEGVDVIIKIRGRSKGSPTHLARVNPPGTGE